MKIKQVALGFNPDGWDTAFVLSEEGDSYQRLVRVDYPPVAPPLILRVSHANQKSPAHRRMFRARSPRIL